MGGGTQGYSRYSPQRENKISRHKGILPRRILKVKRLLDVERVVSPKGCPGHRAAEAAAGVQPPHPRPPAGGLRGQRAPRLPPHVGVFHRPGTSLTGYHGQRDEESSLLQCLKWRIPCHPLMVCCLPPFSQWSLCPAVRMSWRCRPRLGGRGHLSLCLYDKQGSEVLQ